MSHAQDVFDNSGGSRRPNVRRRSSSLIGAVVMMVAAGSAAVSGPTSTATAAAVTTTRAATDDSQTSSASPNRTYGSEQKIAVCNACALSGAPTKRAYLKFDVSNLPGPVTSARLRVYATTPPPVITASTVAPSWNESTITWVNAPAAGAALGSSAAASRVGYVEIPLTSIGTGAFVLSTTSSTVLRLASSETANQPQLVIVTGDVTPTTTTTPPVTPVPVLQYSFDNDAAGVTVTDSSPNALNGTLVNTTTMAAGTPSVAGRGQAITLVGANHQYIAVPEANALDVDTFTLAALVRYTGVQNDKSYGRWEVFEKAGAYWINVRIDGHVRVGGFFGGCTSASWKYLDSTVTLPTNTWTHVAATYNGSTLRVWINGKVAGSQAVTGQTCNNDKPLAIGAKNNPAKGLLEAFWDGQLDDIRIYDRVLTAAEIGSLVPG